MKKLFTVFLIFYIFSAIPAFAEENKILEGNVYFDWAEKSQFERDESISEIKNIINKENYTKKYPKKDFKNKYSAYLKDKNFRKHYMDLKSGINENNKEIMSGFFSKNEKLLLIYGLQYKNDIYTKYYYDAMGNLRYIDAFSKNYPNYPYFTHQYRVDGSLAGSVYFNDKDTQYIFKNDKFSGVWFKNTMFNRKAKKIMTRSNY